MTSKLFQSPILHQEMDLPSVYFDEVFSIQEHDQQSGRAKWRYSIPDDPEANLGGTSRVPDHLQAGFLYRVSVHQDLTEGTDDQGFQGYQCGLCRLPLPSLASLQAHLLVSWTHSTGCNRLYSDMIRLCPSPPAPLVHVSEEPSPSSPSHVHNNQQDQEADRACHLYAVPNDLEAKLGSLRGRCTDHLQADFVRNVSSQASNNSPGSHQGYQGSEGNQCALCQLPFPSLACLQAHLLDSWEDRKRRRDNDVSSRGAPRSPSLHPSFSTLSRGDESYQAGPSLMRPMDNLQSYLPQPYCSQPSHSTLSWGEESHQAGPSKRHRELEATRQGYPGPNCTARRRTTCKTKCKMLQRKALVYPHEVGPSDMPRARPTM
ncbi:uncharacterized protein [Salmo salar]|uniref:C2H2-type domain-containing protein n=1 Tax=Salmo salar TaxID=8030 RepID=A0ABM3F5F7_SALSA|nr:uncharacterized protein LOC106608904 [Salmo salar]